MIILLCEMDIVIRLVAEFLAHALEVLGFAQGGVLVGRIVCGVASVYAVLQQAFQ